MFVGLLFWTDQISDSYAASSIFSGKSSSGEDASPVLGPSGCDGCAVGCPGVLGVGCPAVPGAD